MPLPNKIKSFFKESIKKEEKDNLHSGWKCLERKYWYRLCMVQRRQPWESQASNPTTEAEAGGVPWMWRPGKLWVSQLPAGGVWRPWAFNSVTELKEAQSISLGSLKARRTLWPASHRKREKRRKKTVRIYKGRHTQQNLLVALLIETWWFL